MLFLNHRIILSLRPILAKLSGDCVVPEVVLGNLYDFDVVTIGVQIRIAVYYLAHDGLAAVHSDSPLNANSDNVKITAVTEDDLRNNTIATQLGTLWEQGENYPVIKK